MNAQSQPFPVIQSLIDASESGRVQPCRVQLDKLSFIVMEPPGTQAYCNGNPASLFRSLRTHPVGLPLRYWQLTPREAEQSRSECDEGYMFATQALVWKAAQLAADELKLDSDELYEWRYSLTRWPNFTRLPASDDDLRMAAFWIQKPRTLYAVSAATKLPIEQVCKFFYAASCTGLLTRLVAVETVDTTRKTGVLQTFLGLRKKRTVA